MQQKVKLEKAHGNQILKDQLSDNEESRLCPREGVSGGAENLIGCAWNGLGVENQSRRAVKEELWEGSWGLRAFRLRCLLHSLGGIGSRIF